MRDPNSFHYMALPSLENFSSNCVDGKRNSMESGTIYYSGLSREREPIGFSTAPAIGLLYKHHLLIQYTLKVVITYFTILLVQFNTHIQTNPETLLERPGYSYIY